MARCPGQDSRNVTADCHPCPSCGGSVEIFSDEPRARCRQCGTMVHTEQAPACVLWCKAARECVGPDWYEAIVKQCKGLEEKS